MILRPGQDLPRGKLKRIGYVKKKPVAVKISEPVKQGIRVDSIEGVQYSNKGERIVTGVSGEQYLISDEAFKTYQSVGEGLYVKNDLQVTAYEVIEEITIETSWGKKLIGNIGSVLIEKDSYDRWIIDKDIFFKTYTVSQTE